MRNELPEYPNNIECGIVNIDNSFGSGTHWVCYYKNKNKKYYFNSYGNLQPSKEIVDYLGKDNLRYNEDIVQLIDDPPICGHLCLLVLELFSSGFVFERILNVINKEKWQMIEKLVQLL